MKRQIVRGFGAFLIVFSAACGGKTPSGQTAASAAEDSPHSGSIFFWRASQAGKPGTVYILGSAHLRHDKSTIDRAITDAATTCERGAFEIDLDAVDNTEVAAFVRREGMLHDGKTLRDVVSPETYAAWVKAVEARHLPREQLDKLQPWMAAMTLGLSSLQQGGLSDGSAGVSDNEGVDKMLYAFEKNEPSRKRKVTGLETVSEQLMLFQKVSSAGQDKMLRSAAMSAVKDGSSKVIALYEAGDEAGLVQLFDEARKGDPDEVTQAVLDRRNVSMTEKISTMFDESGCNVVTVGAAHVLGSDGIVRRLKAKGFTLERVAALGPTDAARMAFAVTAPKEFVSAEDGFSVSSDSPPVKQEVAIPGTDRKARIYAFGEGTMAAITISIHDLQPKMPHDRLTTMLDQVTAAGLKKAGLEITKTDTVMVQGASAPRAMGVAKGTNPVRRGVNVSVVHGDRLFMITALQLDDADPKKLDDALAKILATFRVR